MVGGFRVARRFCGPPASGNGGYVAGRLAGFVAPADVPVTVTLRNPPPLETDLRVERAGDEWTLRCDDTLVAEARPGDLALDPVPAVSIELAEAAEERYRGLDEEVFDPCFVCGPGRAEGDGMRLFAGAVGDGLNACVWRVNASLQGADGRIGVEFGWAALDCPGGWTRDMLVRPMVLGRMTAALERLASPGESIVVVGRLDGADGRKTFCSTAAYDSGGALVGRAEQVWIEVPSDTFYPRAGT